MEFLRVVHGLHGQAQGIHALRCHGHADESAGVGGHEVDVLRGGKLPGADEVGFVFAVRVVRHQDEAAHAQLLQNLGQGGVGDGVLAVCHGYFLRHRSRGRCLCGGRRLFLRCFAAGGGIAGIDKGIHVKDAALGAELELSHDRRELTGVWLLILLGPGITQADGAVEDGVLGAVVVAVGHEVAQALELAEELRGGLGQGGLNDGVLQHGEGGVVQ